MGCRILTIAALVLLTVGAWGQTLPQITVQIADERDANGQFLNWATLDVGWDTTPLTVVADHSPITASSRQVWAVPDELGNWWRFTFNRNIVGQYAIRYCFGVPTEQTVWSEMVVAAIYRGPGPKAQ